MSKSNASSSNPKLKGSLEVAPDKSIAQRAVILATIAQGLSEIHNFPLAADPLSTLQLMQGLGVSVDRISQSHTCNLKIHSHGYSALQEPANILDAGNSGTGLRLTLGLLAGHPAGHFATLTGDDSLRRRPMKRIVQPLSELGGQIWGRASHGQAPLSVLGRRLKGGRVHTQVASAQLKSALLLSCLQAEAPLTIVEKAPTRNHTELMLQQFGADITLPDLYSVTLKPSTIDSFRLHIPGDISGAAFFLVAAVLLPGSELEIKNVGLNPTRTGVLSVLREMGARLDIQTTISQGEPVGDLRVYGSNLKALDLDGAIIPNIIDELPVLALAAAQAEGVTEIRDAGELRVKESDRLGAIARLLKSLGVEVEEKSDGLRIQGKNGQPFEPIDSCFDPHSDHRLVMTAAIANLISLKPLTILNQEWADVSFPGFFDKLSLLVSQ